MVPAAVRRDWRARARMRGRALAAGRRPTRRGLVLPAAGAAALSAAALAGWSAAGLTARGTPAAALAARTVTIGPAEVAVSGDWRPVARARSLPELEGARAQAFAPLPGMSVRAVVALDRIDEPTLIPRALAARLSGVPRPSRVELAGLPAWRYADLPGARRGEVVSLTVVPTTAGALSVACAGGRALWSVIAECEAGVREIRLTGARPLEPSAGLSLSLRLPAVLGRLNRKRAAGRAALARARSPRGQARRARRLAAAHGGAARTLARWAPAPERGTAVAELDAVARSYRRLARAAARSRPATYRRAHRAVLAAEARLDRTLRAHGQRLPRPAGRSQAARGSAAVPIRLPGDRRTRARA